MSELKQLYAASSAAFKRYPWRKPLGVMAALDVVRGYAVYWGVNLSGTWETAAVVAVVLLSAVFDVKVLIPQAEAKTTPLADPRDADGNRLTPENGLDRFNTAMRNMATKLDDLRISNRAMCMDTEATFQKHREQLEHILNDPEARAEMEDAPEWFQDLLDAQEASDDVPDELEAPEDEVDDR